MSRLAARQLCFFALVSTLAACTPADKVPQSSNVTLEYAGTSQSRDIVMLTLANGTARSVYFRGNPDPVPGKLTMRCDSPGGVVAGYGQVSVDPAPKEKKIEVKPGERLHLDFWGLLPPDFNDHKHRCHIDLTLEGGTAVESPEFIP
jgi:hypothetical protein